MLSHINVGTGADVTIADLARDGRRGDRVSRAGSPSTRPSPTARPRKLMDVSRLGRMGWRARIPLNDGIAETYRWYLGAHGA